MRMLNRGLFLCTHICVYIYIYAVFIYIYICTVYAPLCSQFGYAPVLPAMYLMSFLQFIQNGAAVCLHVFMHIMLRLLLMQF